MLGKVVTELDSDKLFFRLFRFTIEHLERHFVEGGAVVIAVELVVVVLKYSHAP